ncbi:MAG: hypothetical protein WC023_13165 [Rhodocyclaceae bacterium]
MFFPSIQRMDPDPAIIEEAVDQVFQIRQQSRHFSLATMRW